MERRVFCLVHSLHGQVKKEPFLAVFRHEESKRKCCSADGRLPLSPHVRQPIDQRLFDWFTSRILSRSLPNPRAGDVKRTSGARWSNTNRLNATTHVRSKTRLLRCSSQALFDAEVLAHCSETTDGNSGGVKKNMWGKKRLHARTQPSTSRHLFPQSG